MTCARHVAVLSCGELRHYEARTFVPRVGHTVPCPRHGYCVVAGNAEPSSGGGGHRVRRAPRTSEELVDFVRRNPGRTLAALRRQRFTLRLVHLAEQEGRVRVDAAERVHAFLATLP